MYVCEEERERDPTLCPACFRFDYDLQFTGYQTPILCKCLSPLILFRIVKTASILLNCTMIYLSICSMAKSNLSTSCEPNSLIIKEDIKEFEV